MGKRIFEVAVALIGLIGLAPVLLLVAILVKIDSSGPIFFKGERVGQYGRLFYILKFRTMIPNAAAQGTSVTWRDDPRITRVGRFLRKTKLDELPSLFNVLIGDMSLVGPRPESPAWVARYTPEQRAVLKVKPGITGPAQIKYRDEESLLNGTNLIAEYAKLMNDKLSIDLLYLKNRSFKSDVRIILETIVTLFKVPYPIKK